MADLVKYIFSKTFVKHVVIASASLLLAIFLLFVLMRFYTSHGETRPIPDLVGMHIDDAAQMVDEQGLRITVEDEAYIEDALPGSVISQNPSPTYMLPDSSGVEPRMVKENRRIYVTIASKNAPQVEFPDLKGKSKRIALSLLEITGIEIETIDYVPDRVCTDCVLKVLYKGKEIEPGTKLRKGDQVTLVLGKKNSQYVSIPKISGYTYDEAQTILNRVSLNLGRVVGGCHDCASERDTLSAFVLKQFPDFGNSVEMGTEVDVHLTTDERLLDQ
ncbi:MAG: PASTA domain-containing protein [Flavobacteriales bacterium]|nr:PASTA domain-containing protein [Flavobacteriales bacterium]